MSTYASESELRTRAGTALLDSANSDWLQQCIMAAERAVDRYTRQPPLGTLAYTATASTTRYYNDPNNGVIRMDDALTVTALTRAGTALTVSTDYYLYPYNPGIGPYTEIHLIASPTSYPMLSLGGSGYGYPYRGAGIRQIAVTGTWGFCAIADLPADIKEATLTIALWLLRKPGIKSTDLLQAMGNPNSHELQFARELLEPYRCYGREGAAIV